MPDPLLRYRPEFPILERTTYLISNSLGAMPRGVYDAMKGYADTWATRGVRAWEERWWMLGAEVGEELGALMNAPKGQRLYSPERHHLPGRGRVLPGLFRKTQQGRLQRHELSLGDVFLGSAASSTGLAFTW